MTTIPSPTISNMHRMIMFLLLFWCRSDRVDSFVPTPSKHFHSHDNHHSLQQQQQRKQQQQHQQCCFMAPKNLQADFEYQELRTQLRAMQDQKILSNQLVDAKKAELETYVRRLVNRKESNLQQVKPQLPRSKWRLAFSTQPLIQSLPPGVSIRLDFVNDHQVHYVMEFTKTLGLNKLTAQSSYQVDSLVHPGWVSYTYERITTDVLGLQNVGIGTFGMLQGRSSQIQTVYFDNVLWIEMGKEGLYEYVTVYTREDDDEDDEAWQTR